VPKAKKFKLSAVQKAINRLSPIKFGPDFFTVRVIPPDEWTCGEDDIGCIHYSANTIHIKACGSDSQAIDTLFHECIHGVLSDRAFGKFQAVDIVQAATYNDLGEFFTKTTEVGLTTLFLDNPDLLKLLITNWQTTNRSSTQEHEKLVTFS
jgi:hypothetical protein